jgi:hypothetical protein
MRYFIFFIIIAATGFGIFNATKISFSAPFEGESMIGVITLLASLCAIILMVILLISKRIEQKVKAHKNNV